MISKHVPDIRIAYGFRAFNTKRLGLSIDLDEKRTKEAFKSDCDINNIVKRFQETGQLPSPICEPQFGEAPDLDLKDSLDLVFAARQEFNDLPDGMKAAFGNEDNYYNFLANPDDLINEIGAELEARSDSDSDGDQPSVDKAENA